MTIKPLILPAGAPSPPQLQQQQQPTAAEIGDHMPGRCSGRSGGHGVVLEGNCRQQPRRRREGRQRRWRLDNGGRVHRPRTSAPSDPSRWSEPGPDRWSESGKGCAAFSLCKQTGLACQSGTRKLYWCGSEWSSPSRVSNPCSTSITGSSGSPNPV